jgi:hypothetical protein
MMPPTKIKTQLTGWLRKTPRRERLQEVERLVSTSIVLSGIDTRSRLNH